MTGLADTVHDDGRTGAALGPYAFYDPAFLTWWLGSLYVFPASDQVEIAMGLRSALHTPELQAEIDAFIAHLEGDTRDEPTAEPERAVAVSPPGYVTTGPEQALSAAKVLYDRNPWLVGLGLAGLAIALVKGALFLASEFFRIVF